MTTTEFRDAAKLFCIVVAALSYMAFGWSWTVVFWLFLMVVIAFIDLIDDRTVICDGCDRKLDTDKDWTLHIIDEDKFYCHECAQQIGKQDAPPRN